MNLKQLEYFIDLSSSLSFTQTAKHFYISQTAITKQIQNLEKELNIPLFLRDKKNVSLTKEGTIFLKHAERIMNDVDDALQSVKAYKRGEAGMLHIGFIKNSDEKLIIQILEFIKQNYPRVMMNYRAYRKYELVNLFQKKEIDLMIMLESPSLHEPSLLLKKYRLLKYYHKDEDLEHLPLLYDASLENNEDTELEQTLIKICMKEGYGLLQSFIDESPYSKYLKSVPTNIYSSLRLYYHHDSTLLVNHILETLKKHAF